MGVFLKERAKEFCEEAEEAYKRKRYNLVLFFVEQALQLYIKYLIFKKIDDYPKTHSLEVLFNELEKVYGAKVKKFTEKYGNLLKLIELSYIGARYLPVSFSEENAKESLNLVKIFLKFADEIEK